MVVYVQVRLNRVGTDLPGKILLKLESLEPCSSVKDRIAKSMIEEAEKEGLISPGKQRVLLANRSIFVQIYR